MANLSVQPNDQVTYKVRYEDEHLLVVVKPPHVVTAPGLGHEDDSLLNGLFSVYASKLQRLGKARDFGLLHRLDRETSGLLVVGLSIEAYDAMRELFETRNMAKFYWAVTRYPPNKPAGVINRPLIEHKANRKGKSMKLSKISSAGKPGVTAYRTLDHNANGALLECRAVTGRLHQLRVHLSSIGCPILGDDLYAPISMQAVAPRLALHAHRVAFNHPITKVKVDVRTPFPQDLKSLIKRLGLHNPTVAKPKDAPVGSVEGGHEVQGDAVGDEESLIGEDPV